jgi:hypothetical protein
MNWVLQSANEIREKRIADTRNFAAVFEAEGVPFRDMVAHYVDGTGGQSDHLTHRARVVIDRRARAEGIVDTDGSAFDQFHRVLPDVLRSFCPDRIDAYFDVAPDDSIATFQVFAPSKNTCCQPDLPRRLSRVIHQRQRPGFSIHRAAGLDVFVRPFGHQIYSRHHGLFWPSGSARPLTRTIANAPERWIPGHIVAVQDRFDTTNFAHFLFDYVTRIGHFAEAGLEDMRHCYFILNGIPGPYHALLLRTLSTVYEIPPDRFFFPEEELNLRTHGQIYWFSDATRMYIHPAQMAHPQSIEIIRKVSAHINVEPISTEERIYISRRDADRRRVANEGDVWPLLEQRGFRFITMRDHSVETQIALVRGAKRIIAPHGMGLVHVSTHLGAPAILELLNPESGGDAYALMARSMGFRYDFLTGFPNGRGRDDFAVSAEDLRGYLDEARLPSLADQDRLRNVIPGSARFVGRWGGGGQEELATPSNAVTPLLPGNVVLRHVRSDPLTIPDSNCGYWWHMPVEEGELYTASCFVWIPAEFPGTNVQITIGEWRGQTWNPGDLSVRDQWQRISATVRVPDTATTCSLVLRVEAGGGAMLFSTAWQLEASALPTTYQET